MSLYNYLTFLLNEKKKKLIFWIILFDSISRVNDTINDIY